MKFFALTKLSLQVSINQGILENSSSYLFLLEVKLEIPESISYFGIEIDNRIYSRGAERCKMLEVLMTFFGAKPIFKLEILGVLSATILYTYFRKY